uniref:INCENP_ARK-bind domain-containing protein n=1 Tax=Strongyloides venezuelensis TaxID=75913 RepID=A0A0K0G0S6_STRVS
MVLRRRQRRIFKTINEEEMRNIQLGELSGDDFILEFSSTTFTNAIPEYEVMEDKIDEVANIYDESILDYYEATQRMLKIQRKSLKAVVLQKNSEIKIPKTPKRGKNVSKIDKMHDAIETRKDRITKKNLFVNSSLSDDAIGTSTRGIVVTNKACGTIGLHQDTENLPTTPHDILASKKMKRNTSERAMLLVQQGRSLRRADMKKKDLLKEKAEKAKREREERAKQVEERRRLREQEREKILREKREKEEQIKELKNQLLKPETPNDKCFKTPTVTVSSPKIPIRDIIDISSIQPIEEIETSTCSYKTIVDKSCASTELVYQTPEVPRKRKSLSLRRSDLSSSPSRKNHRICCAEDVTPETTFNYCNENTLRSDAFEKNQLMEFEKRMESILSTNIFAFPSMNNTVFNTSLTRDVQYEIAPAKVPLPSTVDDYNIADLSEGDGTDDEDNPRKTVPKWARMERLQPALKKQHKKFKSQPLSDILNIFGKVNEFKVEEIFKDKEYVRSSSAFWSSPIHNPTHGRAIYQQLNGSAVDSSYFDD